MTIESLRNTIKELAQRGESLELVRLKLELENTIRKQRHGDGPGNPGLLLSLEKRISRIQNKIKTAGKNECWPWGGSRNKLGYGVIRQSNIFQSRFIHRMAFIMNGGTIPNGMIVMHSCDNPPCCNPNHLSVGTNDDNVRDKISKGRQPSVLSSEQVVKILRSNKPAKDLSRDFNISLRQVYSILSKESWARIRI